MKKNKSTNDVSTWGEKIVVYRRLIRRRTLGRRVFRDLGEGDGPAVLLHADLGHIALSDHGLDRIDHLMRGLLVGLFQGDQRVDHAAVGFSVGMRDAKHMDFTDLPLLSPMLGKMLGSGARSTAEVMAIVNSLVLQFFNCYLKGEGVFTVQDIA